MRTKKTYYSIFNGFDGNRFIMKILFSVSTTGTSKGRGKPNNPTLKYFVENFL